MAKYQIHEKIGGGGFADIFRATREDTDEEVAIKMLRDFNNRDARHRFVREVKMLQGLQHRRIIRLIEANVVAQKPFYVMPLMRGGALTTLAGRLPFPTIRAIATELADFLAYLHDQKMIHRDIKPDNILVDEKGQFAVGDFGLGNNPRYTVMFTAHAAGTWGYMAPEMILPNAKANAATDMYALGATLFHLLTGRHPYEAPSLDPWVVRRDIPADLRDLVLSMVQLQANLRPNARGLLALLKPAKPKPKAKPTPVPAVAALFAGAAAIGLVALIVVGIKALLED